jgi:hypothetical protein
MKLRSLGLSAQELETGPFLFLLSHSLPVAYRDTRPEAMRPGLYRTDRVFNKSITRHINTWLRDKGQYATVPHDVIVSTFEEISRFHVSEQGAARRERLVGRATDFTA